MTEHEIKEILRGIVWEVTEINDFQDDEKFMDRFGVDSMSIIEIVARTEKKFEIKFQEHQITQFTNFNEASRIVLDRIIIETISKEEDLWKIGDKFVNLNEKVDSNINIFCFPPGLGLGMAYLDIAKRLENECNFYAIDFLEDYDNYAEMLQEFANQVVMIQDKGPYLFLGYSSGASLAFEVTKVMELKGYIVSDIIMLDSYLWDSDMRNTDMRKLLESGEEMPDLVRRLLETPFGSSIHDSFTRYLKQLNNSGVICANIHNLVVKHRLNDKGWAEGTENNYLEYAIPGTHLSLILPEYIEILVNTISRILKDIQETNLIKN
ncbi:thioesterase domain-containing protein [Paenibacillus tyrfis]|uniref:thioesterase domain-containing protein n=1 Tax=Paenibacillus tyrfis TaxID=1501230 RepID=UPI000B58CD05|nr:thioesterase domain-containing protein [Paenibacillus tyrfis]